MIKFIRLFEDLKLWRPLEHYISEKVSLRQRKTLYAKCFLEGFDNGNLFSDNN